MVAWAYDLRAGEVETSGSQGLLARQPSLCGEFQIVFLMNHFLDIQSQKASIKYRLSCTILSIGYIPTTQIFNCLALLSL